jgi:hypothetical protein
MLDPDAFNALKRGMAQRLLTQMPDAALGELLFTLRELLDYYGERDPSESDAKTVPQRTVILQRMLALLEETQQPETETQEAPQVTADPPQDQPVASLPDETQEAAEVEPVPQLNETQEAPEVEPASQLDDTQPQAPPVHLQHAHRPPAIASREQFLTQLRERENQLDS